MNGCPSVSSPCAACMKNVRLPRQERDIAVPPTQGARTMQPKGTTTVKHTILPVLTFAVVVTALGALSGVALAQNPRGSAEGPTKARGYDHPDQFLHLKDVKPA